VNHLLCAKLTETCLTWLFFTLRCPCRRLWTFPTLDISLSPEISVWWISQF